MNPDSANFITAIVGLGHIAKFCPEEFAPDIKTIVSKVIVKDLLMQDHVSFCPNCYKNLWRQYKDFHGLLTRILLNLCQVFMIRSLSPIQYNLGSSYLVHTLIMVCTCQSGTCYPDLLLYVNYFIFWILHWYECIYKKQIPVHVLIN